MDTESAAPHDTPPPQWKPLPATERRILGVLVEKAKTTPNNYPLSLNAVSTGCNQKSNRDPHMDLDVDDVEDALSELRKCKAVGEVHGDGRVPKYRHYMKEWLGVDGTELAVMAELLLRGTQTVGELRGRAARMAPQQLPDLSVLRPVLTSLIEKGLVISLTPEGRGQLVTHTLYSAGELDRIKTRYEDGGKPGPGPSEARPAVAPAPTAVLVGGTATASSPGGNEELAALRAELNELRAEVLRLKKEVEDIWSNLA